MANFEYYSSSPRRLAVLGAGSYPPAKWNLLGVFEFADVRVLQRFRIQRRVVTRFLRVMFAGKMGREYYCPVSTVRAFGKNLIADWKDVFDAPSAAPAVPSGQAAPSTHPSEGKVRPADTERIPRVPETPVASSGVPPSEKRAPDADAELVKVGKVDTDQDAGDAGEGRDALPVETRRQPAEEDVARVGRASDDATDGVGRDVEGVTGGGVDSAGQEHALGEGMSEDDKIVLEAVRADALSDEAGEENIFRKVTRMIRLLELNQTLTNQYIDTHLGRFAKALGEVQMEIAERRVEGRVAERVERLEEVVRELREGVGKRDVVVCALVVCVALLVGMYLVVWTAVCGARVDLREFDEMPRKTRGDDSLVKTVRGRSISSVELTAVSRETFLCEDDDAEEID